MVRCSKLTYNQMLVIKLLDERMTGIFQGLSHWLAAELSLGIGCQNKVAFKTELIGVKCISYFDSQYPLIL